MAVYLEVVPTPAKPAAAANQVLEGPSVWCFSWAAHQLRGHGTPGVSTSCYAMARCDSPRI